MDLTKKNCSKKHCKQKSKISRYCFLKLMLILEIKLEHNFYRRWPKPNYDLIFILRLPHPFYIFYVSSSLYYLPEQTEILHFDLHDHKSVISRSFGYTFYSTFIFFHEKIKSSCYISKRKYSFKLIFPIILKGSYISCLQSNQSHLVFSHAPCPNINSLN